MTQTQIATKSKNEIKPLALHPMFDALKDVKKLSEEEVDKLREKMEIAREQERVAEEAALNQKRYEMSGVPKKFYAHSLDTYVAHNAFQESLKAQVSAYIADAGNKMLLFYGNNGNGKTHLACAIVRALGGCYTTSFKLCIEYEAGSDFKAKRSRPEVLDFYVAQKMLVIDEIGRFSDEKTEKVIIPAIINMRYEDNLPTVIVSNLSKKEIVEYFGKATYDRMTETCTSIEFKSKSMRQEFREE